MSPMNAESTAAANWLLQLFAGGLAAFGSYTTIQLSW